MPDGWDCEAYGPAGREFGALCFVAEPGTRVCASADECRLVMAAERQRVFRRISELAASGDEAAVFLEGEFGDPGRLLGGEAPDPG